jgi:LemA protein
MISSLVAIVLVLMLLFWSLGAYKRMRRLQRQLRMAFTQLGVQLRRRHQLVADLGDEAKDEALITVVSAHSFAANAYVKAESEPSDSAAVRAMSVAEMALSSALREVTPWMHEHTPKMAVDLDAAEQGIAFAWHVYNHSATQYNESLQQFPSSLIAALFAFRLAPVL